jgi:hypothetical protein
MPDGFRTIPPSEIRGRDLSGWHVVECECWHCHHIRILPHEPLKRGKRGEATLAELNFRCQWCGESGPHKLTISLLPRNW